MAFSGSCHCGRVTFTVDADLPEEAMACNCSYCRRKGMLLAFFPAGKIRVAGEDGLKSYRFNRHVITHRFCENCGTQPLAMARGADGAEMQAINLRCEPAIGLETLSIHHHDGAST